MNANDRNNLNFLLSADIATITNWYARSSYSDIQYALELVVRANEEVNDQIATFKASEPSDELDCTQARTLLSKFSLAGA